MFRRGEPRGYSAPGKRRFIWPVLTGLLVLIAVALGVLYVIPSDYYMLLPGDALPVAPMISIPGHPPARTSGGLFLTDVSLYKVNHKLEELYGRINSQADLQPNQSFSGGLSESSYFALNQQLMNDSIRQAEAAAFTVVRGYHVHFSPAGPRVEFVLPHSPAAGPLRTGDVIEDIDGRRVTRAAGVSPLIKHAHIGQLIHLQVLRGSHLISVGVRPAGSTNGTLTKHGKTPLIGIYVQDQLVLPVHIQVAPGNIGGPSAGLMFTLGIVQRLSQNDITRGCKIAGTGTIDAAGNVGAIGGAKQKVIAAQNAGAQYFLVPNVPDNAGPAKQYGGGLKVLPVNTLREALNVLKRIPSCH